MKCGLVGRLDKETSGVIMFTDDSGLSTALREPIGQLDLPYLHSKSKIYKLCLLPGKKALMKQNYFSELFDPFLVIKELSEPFSFNHKSSEYQVNRCDIQFLRKFQEERYSFGREELGWCLELSVTLKEGKHHQIRRMARRCGFHVVSLQRTCIGGFLNIDLVPEPGDCRMLTMEEVNTLKQGLGLITSDDNY